MNPPIHTAGLGQQIAAHRAYLGLSQRGMARRLGVDRRDYQRIENGRDNCPPGFLDKVYTLVGQFDGVVDTVLSEAEKAGGALNVEVSHDQRYEWERNIAYRAHVIGLAEKPALAITLTVVGESHREAS